VLVRVDPASEVPVFEQIRAQIARKISREELPAGTKLPTIRGLASELGLAVNTVAHAYRELEQSGLIRTRPRHGTTVAEGTGTPVRERLRRGARNYAALAKELGVSRAEAAKVVKDVLDEFVH
jgi:DNA-binding transcriptional regulator YhcF (GntR family)